MDSSISRLWIWTRSIKQWSSWIECLTWCLLNVVNLFQKYARHESSHRSSDLLCVSVESRPSKPRSRGCGASAEHPWGCSARDVSHTSTTQKTFLRRIARLQDSLPKISLKPIRNTFSNHQPSSFLFSVACSTKCVLIRTEVDPPPLE